MLGSMIFVFFSKEFTARAKLYEENMIKNIMEELKKKITLIYSFLDKSSSNYSSINNYTSYSHFRYLYIYIKVVLI